MARVAPGALASPWAARAQGDVDLLDVALTDQARLGSPSVRWWWGRRRASSGRGAVCYLCGAFLVTWDGRWPITASARRAILAHRTVHVAGLARPAPP